MARNAYVGPTDYLRDIYFRLPTAVDLKSDLGFDKDLYDTGLYKIPNIDELFDFKELDHEDDGLMRCYVRHNWAITSKVPKAYLMMIYVKIIYSGRGLISNTETNYKSKSEIRSYMYLIRDYFNRGSIVVNAPSVYASGELKMIYGLTLSGYSSGLSLLTEARKISDIKNKSKNYTKNFEYWDSIDPDEYLKKIRDKSEAWKEDCYKILKPAVFNLRYSCNGETSRELSYLHQSDIGLILDFLDLKYISSLKYTFCVSYKCDYTHTGSLSINIDNKDNIRDKLEEINKNYDENNLEYFGLNSPQRFYNGHYEMTIVNFNPDKQVDPESIYGKGYLTKKK